MKTSVLSTSLAAAFLLTAGCTGEDGRQGAPGPSGTLGDQGDQGDPGVSGELDPSLATWDKAVAGIGGQAALDGFTGFTVEASGVRKLGGEGLGHGDPEVDVDYFDISTHVDMANGAMRVDWARTILFFGGAPLSYSEIINGDLGYVEGDDSIFGPPPASTTDMPSGRLAAVRKQAMLTNPHGYLAMVNADPAMASDGGVALYNGAIHQLLVVQDAVYPVTLYVNASTGRVAKLSTVENDHLHRDIPIEVHFHDWMNDMNGGLAFPMSVYLTVNGQIWHEEYRSAVTQNPAFTDEFDFPPGGPAYDEAAAMWGMSSHQFIQGFNSLGITQNFEQLTVVPDMLDNGVYFLGGSSHNSMAIEQQNGVVILEAPLYPERSEAILAWVEATFAKPVTHLVITHHHHDHSAGFRAFVAAGAEIVVGEASAGYYRELAGRPSSIVPDAQAMNPMEPNIVGIADGDSYLISDFAPLKKGERGEKGAFADVTVYQFDSAHADDMVMAHVGVGGGYIFQSDLFNPDPTGGFALAVPFAQQLLDAINANGLNVAGATLVGGHSLYAPLTQLEDYLAPPP